MRKKEVASTRSGAAREALTELRRRPGTVTRKALSPAGGQTTAHREISRDPFPGVQIRIGVMGSASEPAAPALASLSQALGQAIADRGCCLLTGASPGLPHEAVLGAREVGGHVVGISPA